MVKDNGGRFTAPLTNFGITDKQTHDAFLADCEQLYDKLSGTETSDLKTFGIAVFVAFKE